MKKILFTIAITLIATFEMSGQNPWIGNPTSTTSVIERGGDVRIAKANLSILGNQIIGYNTWETFNLNGFVVGQYGLTRMKNVVGLSGWNGLSFFTNGKLRISVDDDGNVGIGSSNPDERLTVKGKIHAEEVRVDLNIPADYVFEKYYTGSSTLKEDYTMPTLEEVEMFTKEHNHLPEMPSAAQIQEDGLQLGNMTNLLLQKIEELTLYTIEQEKRIKALEATLNK